VGKTFSQSPSRKQLNDSLRARRHERHTRLHSAWETCPECSGRSRIDEEESADCSTCDGVGQVLIMEKE